MYIKERVAKMEIEKKIDMLIEKWNEAIKSHNKALKWFFRGVVTGIVIGILCACVFGLFLILVNT